MKFKNISSLGGLYVPALDATIAAGETADVEPDVGVGMSAQPDSWQAVDKEAKAAAADNIEPKQIEPDDNEPETPATPAPTTVEDPEGK